MRRELFYYTQNFRCNMRDLEREVNPFELTRLRTWLDECDDRIARVTGGVAAGSNNSSRTINGGGSTSDGSTFSSSSSSTATTLSRAHGTGKRSAFTASMQSDAAAEQEAAAAGAAAAAAGATAAAASASSPLVEFWEIPQEDLRLQSKVSAGADGIVWKAMLRGRVVAAKQLLSFQNMDRDQGPQDLAREVGRICVLCWRV
jgi:hypothetical protein